MVEGKSTPLEDIMAEVLNEEWDEHVPPMPSPIRTPLTPTLPARTEEPQDPLQPEPEFMTQFSPLPEAPSFLSDLFADDFSEADDLRYQLNRINNNQQALFSLMSKMFGAMQTIWQLLGTKEILNGVDFSAVREQKQEVFGATQNIGQIGSAKESSLEVHSISPNDSLPNLNSLEQVQNESARDSEINVSVEDPVLSEGLGGEEDTAFFREIIKIKGESCSIGNFAVKLVRKFYSVSELVNRNCKGTRGKEPLEPTKLAKVRECTFKIYPTPSTLKEEQWKKCVIAIDEYLRRKKKEASGRQD